MPDLTTTDTILPPVRQHVAEMTRALIERKANGTDESARIKLGPKSSFNVRRSDGGEVKAYLHDGHGGGCTLVNTAEDARTYAEALNAFADALDAQTEG